jgi:transcriptional regulator with XRE-family HTH domain
MSTTDELRPADRLKAVRKRLGKSQAAMAKLLKLSTSGYQNYERGERELPATVIDRAQDELGVNPAWLWDGVGDMFRTPKRVVSAEDFFLEGEGRPGDTMDNDSPSKQRHRAEAVAIVSAAVKASGCAVPSGLRLLMRELVLAHGVSSDLLVELAQVVEEATRSRVESALLSDHMARSSSVGGKAEGLP